MTYGLSGECEGHLCTEQLKELLQSVGHGNLPAVVQDQGVVNAIPWLLQQEMGIPMAHVENWSLFAAVEL